MFMTPPKTIYRQQQPTRLGPYFMAGEIRVDREGPSPTGPIASISWVGPGGVGPNI